jgi:hypothetical protein
MKVIDDVVDGRVDDLKKVVDTHQSIHPLKYEHLMFLYFCFIFNWKQIYSLIID